MNTRLTRWATSALLLIVLVACGGGGGDTDPSPSGGNNGGGTDTSSNTDVVTSVDAAVYSGDYATEKAAVFSLLNTYRSQCGFGKLAQNSLLDQAAQNHSAYSRVMQEGHYESPGQPGFTGITSGDRVASVGYNYSSGGEVIGYQLWGDFVSGTEGNGNSLVSVNELSAVANLKEILTAPYHLAGALSLDRDVGMGISNHVISPTSNIKVLNINYATKQGVTKQSIASGGINTFPCDGTTGVAPVFESENPDPFPEVNRSVSPYGQPLYVMTAVGSTVTLDSGRSTITPRGGLAVPTRLLTQSNDPNARLASNQVFLVPTTRLADNTAYDVVLHGTLSTLVTDTNPTGSWTRSFTFYTGKFRGE